MMLTDLSDAQLLESLRAVCAQSRLTLARLLAHLGEVEERRLHLEAAFPSMYEFCCARLGMSDGEACRRITAARLARRFPDLLDRIERGDIKLSTVVLLRDDLTGANYEELLTAVAGKTKREVQDLLVARRRAAMPAAPLFDTATPAPAPASTTSGTPAIPGSPKPSAPPRREMTLVMSDELRQKIARAADLMRHRNPNGDLAVIVERAVDLLVAKLEKERLGKTSRAQATPRRPHRPGYVPRAVRREVFARDGERCTFCDAHGKRCTATTLLELDHVVPRARGGPDTLENLRARCRAHNRLHAEKTFGRAHVERAIHQRQNGHDCESLETVRSALVHNSLRDHDARRALRVICERHPLEEIAKLSLEALLREALAVLT
jgi:5-methylcytosine-specific restriction endonuclease McrA